MSNRIPAIVVGLTMAAGALALATPATAQAAPAASVVRAAAETRIVGFDASRHRVWKGDKVTLTGRLQVEGKRFWKGLDDQKVAITFKKKGSGTFEKVTEVTTGAKGAFEAEVTAEATGVWRAEFAATDAAKESRSGTELVVVRPKPKVTKIVGFDAGPEPVKKGDRLSVRGTLLLIGDDGKREGLPGQRVLILFKENGSGKWKVADVDRTGRDGRIRESVVADKSGWWRAVYKGRPGVIGSGSRPDHVKVEEPKVKADTRVFFDAFKEPAKRGKYLHFKGLFQVAGEDGFKGAKAPVKLYFKPKFSDDFRVVKTMWSRDNGRFYAKSKVWRSGWWKAVYEGDDETKPSESKRDWVRVKR